MTTNFLRAYNNGNVYMPQSIEEDEILNKKNILHYFNFADGCIFDRRFFFQVDYCKFSTRDAFPEYSSLNNIKFEHLEDYAKRIYTGAFNNFKDVEYEVTGQVKVTYKKQSDLNLNVMVGVATSDVPDACKDWRGLTIKGSKALTGMWHDFYGTFKATSIDNTKYISPWFSIQGNSNEISEAMYVEFKNVSIIPKSMYMPDIEIRTKIRYITLDVQGWVDVLNDTDLKQYCNLLEIKAFTSDGTNIALNKPVTTIPDKSLANNDVRKINDGDINIANYVCFDRTINSNIRDNYYSFTIDLQDVYDIDYIEIYNFPKRKYSFSVKVGQTQDKMACVYNNEFNNNVLRPLIVNKDVSTNPLPCTINLKDMLFNNNLNGYLACHPEKTFTYNLSDFKEGVRLIGDTKFIPYRNDMDFSMNPPIITDYLLEMNPSQTADNNYISRFVLGWIYSNDMDINNYNLEFSCWMFVEPGFNGPYGPLLKVEEYPEYSASTGAYDITKLGTWQYLKAVYKGKVSPNNINIEYVTPIIQSVWNSVWTKGRVFITGISINKIKKVNTCTETGLIQPEYCILTPNIIKPTNFTLYTEFEMVNEVNDYKTIFNDFGINSNFKLTIFANNTIEVKNNGNMFVTNATVKKGLNKLAFSLQNNVMKLSLNGSTIESKSCSWNIPNNMKLRFFNKSINESITDNIEPFYNKLCKLVVYDDVKTEKELQDMTRQQKSFKLRENTFNQLIDESILTKNIKQLIIDKTIIKYFPLSGDDKDILSSTKLVSNYTSYNFYSGKLYSGEHSSIFYSNNMNGTNIFEATAQQNLSNISIVFRYICPIDNGSIDIWFGDRTNKTGLVNIPLRNTGLSSEYKIKSMIASGQKVFIQIKNVEVEIIDFKISSGDKLVPGSVVNRYPGFKINYSETMGDIVDNSFTLCYKVKVLKKQLTGNVEAISPTGRITLLQIGKCDKSPKFIMLGKPGSRDAYPVMLYSNIQQGNRVKTYESFTEDDWINNEITVISSFNALNNTFSFCLLFENGKKVEDTIQLTSKLDTNSIKDDVYEFTVGSITSEDRTMNFTMSDLIMINRYMNPSEVKNILSPISLSSIGLRSGFEVSELKNI